MYLHVMYYYKEKKNLIAFGGGANLLSIYLLFTNNENKAFNVKLISKAMTKYEIVLKYQILMLLLKKYELDKETQ